MLTKTNMQHLHTKFTQKYQSYHHWHQTKHHNKAHWGVLVILTFLASILILNSNNQTSAQASVNKNQEQVKTEIYTINIPPVSILYYVSPVGNDINNGSITAPFKTISKALSIAKAGDTIYLLSGTYNELISFPVPGTVSARITLKAYNQEPVTITRTGRVVNIGQPYITIEDVVIDGNWGIDDAVKITSAANYLIFKGVEIKNTKRDAVDMASPRGVLIENTKIHDAIWVDGAVRNDAHGIVTAGVKDLTIRAVEIYYVSGDAVQFQYGGWNNILIEDSTFWNGPLPTPRGGALAGVYPGENAIDTKYYAADGRGKLP